VDTINRVAIMIYSSLTNALHFVRTVLSVKWLKIIVIGRLYRNGSIRQQLEINKKLISNHVVKIKPKSQLQFQTLVEPKRMSNWNELINKRVKTCEMSYIGHVIAVDNQSMTILHYTNQQLVIPTYYIREYDQENVLIDISIRYLHHYKSEEKIQQPHIQK
jgi:hypothetical protein